MLVAVFKFYCFYLIKKKNRKKENIWRYLRVLWTLQAKLLFPPPPLILLSPAFWLFCLLNAKVKYKEIKCKNSVDAVMLMHDQDQEDEHLKFVSANI